MAIKWISVSCDTVNKEHLVGYIDNLICFVDGIDTQLTHHSLVSVNQPQAGEQYKLQTTLNWTLNPVI